MKTPTRIRLAIQKSGRLNNDSIKWLLQCGLKINYSKKTLICPVENFPIDILFVRDDDIPSLVMNGVCELGIVGENVLLEQTTAINENEIDQKYHVVKKLGFSRCRLSIAIANEKPFANIHSLRNLRIATSYPHLLTKYLNAYDVPAKILTISGSVEIAPRLGMADAICDLVATGKTLKENNLKEVEAIIQSQALLMKTLHPSHANKKRALDRFLSQIA